MKVYKKVIFLFLIITGLLHPQSKDSTEVKNSLQKGKFALMFGISSLDLTALDGGFISLKYNLTDHFSIRTGLYGNYYHVDRNEDNYLSNSTSKLIFKNNKYELSIITYLVYYPLYRASVNLYFGLGPFYRLYHEKYSDIDEPFTRMEDYLKEEWSSGLNGIAAIEWFAYRNISFFGEYSFGCFFGKRNNTYIYTTQTHSSERNEKIDINGFDSYGARLGIAVYFDFPF